MPQYQTKQRSILLSYLDQHADEMLSAAGIADALKTEGISQSAVYRNLQMLENEGLVRKQVKSGIRENYYQYLGSNSCKGYLHLQCMKCGLTIHMKHTDADELAGNLKTTERFDLSIEDTVLYGVCEHCK